AVADSIQKFSVYLAPAMQRPPAPQRLGFFPLIKDLFQGISQPITFLYLQGDNFDECGTIDPRQAPIYWLSQCWRISRRRRRDGRNQGGVRPSRTFSWQ